MANPIAPHHRNVAGGPARAAVFGASDGLVTNVSLVLGVAGAEASGGLVRLAGLAGLVAGAISMAAGEYISMKAQSELLEHEVEMERTELSRHPAAEEAELASLYVKRGISERLAKEVASEVMADPERALQAHAREELGVDLETLSSPWKVAVSSMAAFICGAIIPLLPWFFYGGAIAVGLSLTLSAIGALGFGLALGTLTGRSRAWSAARQLLIASLAAGITFAVGSAVGTGGIG